MADRRADTYKYIRMCKKHNLIFRRLHSIQAYMVPPENDNNNLDLLLSFKNEAKRVANLIKSNEMLPKDGIILLQNKKALLSDSLTPWLTDWGKKQFQGVAPGVFWEKNPEFTSTSFALEDFFPDSICYLNSLIESAKVDHSLVFIGESKEKPVILHKYGKYKLGKSKEEFVFWNGNKLFPFDKEVAFAVLTEFFKQAENAIDDQPKSRAIEKNILFKKCGCENSDLSKIFTSTKNDSLEQIFKLIQKHHDKSAKKMYYSL